MNRSQTNVLHRQLSHPLPDIATNEGVKLNHDKVWSLNKCISEEGLPRHRSLLAGISHKGGDGATKMRNNGAGVLVQEYPRQETILAEEATSLQCAEEEERGEQMGESLLVADGTERGVESGESLWVVDGTERWVESKGNGDNRREEAEGEEMEDRQVIEVKDREGEREDVWMKEVVGEGEFEKQGVEGEVICLKHMESVSEEIRRSPGFKFLTRPDLYKFVKVREITTIIYLYNIIWQSM